MTIKLGDKVYQKRRGWSGVPMTVVGIEGSDAKTIVCVGADGWGVDGLYSLLYEARVARFHENQLSHIPDNAV